MPKHKQTKATDISIETKKIVAERDSIDGHPCCILCGNPNAACNAHVIRRSSGGKGIPENVVTLCYPCHRTYDQGKIRLELEARIFAYMRSRYDNWDEIELTYRKD